MNLLPLLLRKNSHADTPRPYCGWLGVLDR